MDPKRNPKAGAGLPQAGPRQPAKPGLPGSRPGAQAPAAQPAPGRPGIGDALDQLSREIQQLRVDFERFFNGGLHLPPEELRGRVQAQLRNLRGSNLTSVDSFRLGDLEARFNSYNELFNRRLREAEEGRHAALRSAPPPAPREHDPSRGIVFGDRLDPAAVEALYQGLAASPGDGPRFDLDSFQTYLKRQVDSIRDKTGCAQVQFRLATEDGKVKLKARPVTVRDS